MNGPDERLKAEMDSLNEADEDQLYEILGARASAMARNPAVAGDYAVVVTAPEVRDLGGSDWLKRLGRRIFRRLNREAHELLCGTSADTAADREKVKKALLGNHATAAALLAAALVAHLGIAPAVAAVVAALVMKRFFRPVYEETCEQWKDSLGETDEDD